MNLSELSAEGLLVASIGAIVLHVVNYNSTARLEYNTRIFTKIFGGIAIYLYAIYLVCSALARDYVIEKCLGVTKNTISIDANISSLAGQILFYLGIALNLWTLKALGIKGMYNGDSFGHLFDAPVTGGPYKFFNDPQYVGTTVSMLGSALYYRSLYGLLLTIALWVTFSISVKYFEGPHMNRIYANKNKKQGGNVSTQKKKRKD